MRERHEATDHAVEEGVCKLEIAGSVDLQRQGLWAFFSLLLELQSVKSPVRGVANDHFVAHMMLDGHGVNPAAGGRIGNLDAGTGIRAWCPNVLECSAPSVSDPQTGVLTIPGIAVTHSAETTSLPGKSNSKTYSGREARASTLLRPLDPASRLPTRLETSGT